MKKPSLLYRLLGRPISRHLLSTLLGYPVQREEILELHKFEAFLRLCHIGDRTALTLKQIADLIDERRMTGFAEHLPRARLEPEHLPKAAELINLEYVPVWRIAVQFGIVTPALQSALERWRDEYADALLRTKLTKATVAKRVKLATGMDWDPSMHKPAMDPVLREYALEHGPVPRMGSGPIAAAFWSGYIAGPRNVGLKTQNPEMAQAFLAGMHRAKIEPGLYKKRRKRRSTPRSSA